LTSVNTPAAGSGEIEHEPFRETAMTAPKPIESIAELFAHALAIEREAAARYAEFARFMEDHDNLPVAALFDRLAKLETEHAEVIAARARGHQLPMLDSYQHSWVDAGAPETVAHEFIFRLMTPHDALRVALEAERRARDWFEQIFATSTDPDVKALAATMLQEEQQHMAWVERALAADPDPNPDWAKIFAHRRVSLPPGGGTLIPIESGKTPPPKRKPAVAKKRAAPKRPAKKAAARRAAPKKPGSKKPAPGKAARRPAAKRAGAKRK
jgi:rubrerythrin